MKTKEHTTQGEAEMIRGEQQSVELIIRTDMLQKGEPSASGKTRTESSSRISGLHTQLNNTRVLQREGLVNKRKKLGMEHERGTMVRPMVGKSG